MRYLVVVAMMLLGAGGFSDVLGQSLWQIKTPRETHDIPSDNGKLIPYPTVKLQAGMRYRIVSSGFVYTQFPKTDQLTDANFLWEFISFPAPTFSTGIKCQYDGTNFDWLYNLSNVAARDDHNYTQSIVSQSASLSFLFFDRQPYPSNYYADNKGVITIEVAQQTPQLVAEFDTLDFGGVDFRAPKTMIDSIESYGTDNFDVDSVTLTGSTDFSLVRSDRGTGKFSLSTEQTDEFQVRFAPTMLGPEQGELRVYNHKAFFPRDQIRIIELRGIGHGPILHASIDTLHFGLVKINSVSTKIEKLVNTGDRPSTVQSLLLLPATPFSIPAMFPTDIPANSSIDVPVTFQPTIRGAFFSAALPALENGLPSLRFYMDGSSGNGIASFLPDTLFFDTVIIGDRDTRSTTLKNIGTTPLDLNSFTQTNSTDFIVRGTAAPYTLDTSGAKSYAIDFQPTAHLPNGLHLGKLIFKFQDTTKEVVLIGYDHEPILTNLSIGKYYYTRPGNDVVVRQYLNTGLTGTLRPVKSFSEQIQYNAAILDAISVNKGALLSSADWTLNSNLSTKGVLDIQGLSSGAALSGPGEFVTILFHVHPDAADGDSSLFPQSNIKFGVGLEPVAFSLDGMLHIQTTCSPTHVEASLVPATFIEQNFPNPFNVATDIPFHVGAAPGETIHVRGIILNLMGTTVQVMVDREFSSGDYTYRLDGSSLVAGTYIYSFEIGGKRVQRIMRLIR